MELNEIREELEKELGNVKDLKELNELHVKYLSKKGIITELNSKIKDVPNEEKKDFGRSVNELRTLFNDSYNEMKNKF